MTETVVTKKTLGKAIKAASKAVRENNPLTPSITNNITIDFVANTQLAVGGSAAMVYMEEEGKIMAQIADAMYLNVGGLIPLHLRGIVGTAEELSKLGKPYVLDPVAIGIGDTRTKILSALKNTPPAIIRGNASEVMALANLWGVMGQASAESTVRGVDSTDPVEAALPAAMALAKFCNGAVAVSGKVDIVTDGTTVVRLEGGSQLMASVTGFGCTLGGVCAVYLTQADPFTAAVAAVAHYNVAGVQADKTAFGPASFKVKFIDALYNTKAADLKKAIASVETIAEESAEESAE